MIGMVRPKIKDAKELKIIRFFVYLFVIIVVILLSTLYVKACV